VRLQSARITSPAAGSMPSTRIYVLERIDGVRHAEALLPDNRDGAAHIAGQPERHTLTRRPAPTSTIGR
jgi:hypothetical protein